MSLKLHFCKILVTLLFLLEILSAFNLDTKNPIIFTNSYDGEKSMFGATVAIGSKRLNGGSSSRNWLFVGSPRASSRASRMENVKNPGVVWRCSLGKPNGDSCSILEMDKHGNEEQSHHAKGGPVVNRKDDALIGGSLWLGQDRLISCGSKWANQRANMIKNTSHYLMNGICYWQPKDQVFEDIVPDPPQNHTLIPLRDKERQGFKGLRGFDWTFGQAGFSIHTTNDKETILGSPGVHDWKGAVVRLSDSIYPRLRRNGQPEAYGTFFQAPQIVVKPQLTTLWKENATYFGYAVSSGKYLDLSSTVDSASNRQQFAAGAPRGGFAKNLTGHILVFTFPKNGDEPLNVLDKIEGPLEGGTYFGSVICSVDINADGWTDLLVGAPFYNSRRNKRIDGTGGSGGAFFTGTKESSAKASFLGHGDEGAVFIYLSRRDKMIPKGVISGNNEAWSHFGSSIASIGDINKDGFNDIAIGAPYEDSGRGAIYIYHGSESGLSNKFVQVIHAKKLDDRLRGFGFSLSPGIDIDSNGYNDIAVGSYASNQVVVFRTQPIVELWGTIKSNITKLTIGRGYTFGITTCVRYKTKDSIGRLGVKVRLLSDVDSKQTRVFITDNYPDSQTASTYEYYVTLIIDEPTCRDFIAIVKRNLNLVGNAVTFQLDVSIKPFLQAEGNTEFTILPQASPLDSVPRTQGKGIDVNSFCKNCPVTSSNVTTVKASFQPTAPCGDDEVCFADLEYSVAFANYTPGTSFVIGSSDHLNLSISIVNKGEAAIHPKVTVSWRGRSLTTTPSDCSKKQLYGMTNLTCSLGQMLRKGQTKSLEVEFDMSDLMGGAPNTMDEFVVSVDVHTTSELLSPVVIPPLILPLVAEASIDLIATKKDMNLTTVNPYNVFTHSYLMILEGTSPVMSIEIHLEIPMSLQGTPETILANITQFEAKHDGNPLSCEGPSELDFLFNDEDPDIHSHLGELESTQNLRKRRRRSSENDQVEASGKTFLVSCDYPKQFTCIHIVCLAKTVYPRSRTSIDITFRMASNSTVELLDKYKTNRIEFKTKAKAIINGLEEENPRTKESSVILKNPLVASNATVWIASSVAAGIFIILIFALLLICCGVFDKKKPVEPSETEQTRQETVPLQNLEAEIPDGKIPD